LERSKFKGQVYVLCISIEKRAQKRRQRRDSKVKDTGREFAAWRNLQTNIGKGGGDRPGKNPASPRSQIERVKFKEIRHQITADDPRSSVFRLINPDLMPLESPGTGE